MVESHNCTVCTVCTVIQCLHCLNLVSYTVSQEENASQQQRRVFKILIFPFIAKLCDKHRTLDTEQCHVWGLVLRNTQKLRRKQALKKFNTNIGILAKKIGQ